MTDGGDTAGRNVSFEVRTPRPDELDELEVITSNAFGRRAPNWTDAQNEREDRMRPLDRRILIVDRRGADAAGTIAGGCYAYDLSMSLPGGTAVPVAALAGVGVGTAHIGRGAMRLLVNEHLRRSKAAGDAASVLMSSESGIYGRFGYGMATEYAEFEARSLEIGFRADPPGGTIEMLHLGTDELTESAIGRLGPCYNNWARQTPGALSRSDEWWHVVLGNVRLWRGGGKHQFAVVHVDDSGEIDGYLLYRIEPKDETLSGHGRPVSSVIIHELLSTNVAAELALFDYAISVPLTRAVHWELAPLRPALQTTLTDRRHLWQTARLDMMWLRPLNLSALLEQRAYRVRSHVTFELDDQLFDDLRGPWKLEAHGGKGTLNRFEGEADVRLGPAELGSLVLGGTRAIDLAAVGHIEGSADAVRRFDLLLQTDAPPFNLSKF